MAKSTAPSSPPRTPVGLDAPSSPPLPDTYEAALKELESLVMGLDSGQLPLEQLLVAYQRGAQLLAFCKSKLAAIEDQVKVVEGGEIKSWPAPQ